MKIDLTQTHDVDGVYEAIDWSEIRQKYKDPGTQYCFDILDKKILAGYLIKLACFRHLRDLQRQGNKDFPYHYDVEEENKALKLAKIIPDVDQKKVLPLMDFEKFILAELNAWKDKNGERRFIEAHISLGRGQGKTQIAGMQMVKAFIVDTIGFTNKDFMISANTTEQTKKLFGYIGKMISSVIEIEPFKTFAKKTDLQIQANQIIQKTTNNRILRLSYEANRYDSTHNVLAIYDEAGALTDFDRISDIIDGQGQVVPYHQFIKISSAYPDPTGPFHQEEKAMQNVMEQDFKRKGDNMLCCIWAQDDIEETYKPKTWAKSNPLINLSPEEKDRRTKNLINQRDQALLTNTLHKFQNKELNIWLKQSTSSYLSLQDVEAAIDNDFKIKGREVYIGLDYSMYSDNTALAFVFPYRDKNGKPHWHITQHSFIPFKQAGSIEAKEKLDGIAYREFPQYCTITSIPEGIINPEQIYKWLLQYVEDNELQVVFLGYDHYGSFQVKNITESLSSSEGWLIQDIAQRTSELGNPTKFLQESFATGKITRFNDPIMEKALLNATIKEDKIGIQVEKDKATFKIDVVDAIIDAMYRAMDHFEEYGLTNDKSTVVDRMTAEQVKDWFENPESGLL